MNKAKWLSGSILLISLLIFVVCNEQTTEPGGETALTSLLLNSPAYGSYLMASAVELKWYGAADASTYEVMVDNSSDFSDPVFTMSGVVDTTTTTDSLNPGVYYWRAKADNGKWSNVWIFTIGSSSQVGPTTMIPANGAAIYDSTIVFDWNNFNGAVTYDLQVDTSGDFSHPLIDLSGLTKSDHTVPDLPDAGLYFWRCRGRGRTDEKYEWSAPSWFAYWLVIDIDGNAYKAVEIGGQVWMAENLKVQHFRNGDPVTQLPEDQYHSPNTYSACCYYDDDPDNIETWGLLYNFLAATHPDGLAPDGWRVPTSEDFDELDIALGMDPGEVYILGWRGTDEGGKLKETGTAHWNSPNTGATDQYEFKALGGGRAIRYFGNSPKTDYDQMGQSAYFWSSSAPTSNEGTYIKLSYDSQQIYHIGTNATLDGYSIRCVKN